MAQNHTTTTERYHAICPLCVRIVSKEDKSEVREIVENHNDQRHDGEPVAHLVAESKEALNQFMDYVKAEHGPDVYGKIGAHIVQKDPMGVLP